LGAVLPGLPQRRGRRPRRPLAQVLPALVFDVMHSAGTLAEHFGQLLEDRLCESSLSERRRRLPGEVFSQWLPLGLPALAPPARHPEALWRNWRRLALAGTQFSRTNPPQVKATRRKAKSRPGRAALAKIATRVLLAWGLHNPLAAALGRRGPSAWARALAVWAPWPAQARGAKVGSHFPMRARSQIHVQTLQRWKEGRRLVRRPLPQKGRQRILLQWLQEREICARVHRPGFRSVRSRLWTSLLEPEAAPALAWVPLHRQRWEQALYDRQRKCQLRKTDVLQSHTLG
jgi:hypothetical protein